MSEPTALEALRLQSAACAVMGSALYRDLFAGLAVDYEAGGPTFELLHDRPRIWADAVHLRMVGATHRLALTGAAPALASHYPSCGGTPGAALLTDHRATLEDHRAYVEGQLDRQVQTNEIGRTAALAVGFAALARRYGHPLRTFEVGASAGLISRWHRYWFDAGATACGDPVSTVRFTDSWARPPDLGGDPQVVERAACDITPLDATDAESQLRLLSFVWPDQAQRFERLRLALDIAAGDPLTIDTAAAGEWVADRVGLADGATTVVFHTIVWQYLSADDKHQLRDHLAAAGAQASAAAPLAWLRMEPAGAVADLRLTTWPGGETEVLATSGYHGADITPGPGSGGASRPPW